MYGKIPSGGERETIANVPKIVAKWGDPARRDISSLELMDLQSSTWGQAVTLILTYLSGNCYFKPGYPLLSENKTQLMCKLEVGWNRSGSYGTEQSRELGFSRAIAKLQPYFRDLEAAKAELAVRHWTWKQKGQTSPRMQATSSLGLATAWPHSPQAEMATMAPRGSTAGVTPRLDTRHSAAKAISKQLTIYCHEISSLRFKIWFKLAVESISTARVPYGFLCFLK